MGITQNRDKDAILRVAKQAAADWGFQPDLKELGDCENIVYKALNISGRPFILRVTEPIHRTKAALKAELSYVDFLKTEGLSVCASIKNPKSGQTVEELTDTSTGNTYFVSVSEFADGRHFDLKKDWNKTFPVKLGKLMAEFRLANQKYSQKPTGRHTYFDCEHVKNALKYIPVADTTARAEWKLAHDWVKSLPQNADTFGLCHTDMHTGNFFLADNGDINVFDFDDSSHNFYLYDLMIMYIVDGLKDKGLTNPTPAEFQDLYINAYADKLGITDTGQLKQDLDNFKRLRNIEMYASVSYTHLTLPTKA